MRLSHSQTIRLMQVLSIFSVAFVIILAMTCAGCGDPPPSQPDAGSPVTVGESLRDVVSVRCQRLYQCGIWERVGCEDTIWHEWCDANDLCTEPMGEVLSQLADDCNTDMASWVCASTEERSCTALLYATGAQR